MVSDATMWSNGIWPPLWDLIASDAAMGSDGFWLPLWDLMASDRHYGIWWLLTATMGSDAVWRHYGIWWLLTTTMEYDGFWPSLWDLIAYVRHYGIWWLLTPTMWSDGFWPPLITRGSDGIWCHYGIRCFWLPLWNLMLLTATMESDASDCHDGIWWLLTTTMGTDGLKDVVSFRQ